MEELIIGINRNRISGLLDRKNYGLIESEDEFYSFILDNIIVVDRASVENDPSIKQIIPYVILCCNSKFVLLKRKPTQNETRLHNKMSIGIGGHINPTDTPECHDIIISGLYRELNEEVHILNHSKPEFIGYINDDISEVGSVHLGLLYRINILDRFFEVREKDKMEGSFVSLDYIYDNYENLESWSKIVFDDYLIKSSI